MEAFFNYRIIRWKLRAGSRDNPDYQYFIGS